MLWLAGGDGLSELDLPPRRASNDWGDWVAPQLNAVLFRALDRGGPGDAFDYGAPSGTPKRRVTIVGECPTGSGAFRPGEGRETNILP